MKIERKFFIRRNLDSFAEIEFANFLWQRSIQPFYPFKDVGVDMLGFDGEKVEFYQLKARHPQLRHSNIYWFFIRKKDIPKLSKLKNAFFILCALQPNETFHYFKLPIKVVKNISH